MVEVGPMEQSQAHPGEAEYLQRERKLSQTLVEYCILFVSLL